MRGNPPKVTEVQRQEVLRVYREEGTKAAEALCISLGLNGRYFSQLASARGVARKKSKPLTPEQKAQMKAVATRFTSDHRWQWAKERGAVIA